MFRSRSFSQRSFSPTSWLFDGSPPVVVPPPAPGSSAYAPGIIHRPPRTRHVPALRRQQLEEDELVITLVQALYACGFFED